jgi:hypothetical protein
MGDRRGGYRVLVEGPEGNRSLGRHRRGWEDNIKMELHEVDWGGSIGWIDLAQDSDNWRVLLNAVNKPSVSTKCGEYD